MVDPHLIYSVKSTLKLLFVVVKHDKFSFEASSSYTQLSPCQFFHQYAIYHFLKSLLIQRAHEPTNDDHSRSCMVFFTTDVFILAVRITYIYYIKIIFYSYTPSYSSHTDCQNSIILKLLLHLFCYGQSSKFFAHGNERLVMC